MVTIKTSTYERLIQTIKKQQQNLSLLCPIGDMPIIEILKAEKLAYMEEIKALKQELERERELHESTMEQLSDELNYRLENE